MKVTAATVIAGAALLAMGTPARAEPPFRDLPWTWPGIITSADPSSLQDVTYAGRGRRDFWESWRWVEITVHVYTATYRDGTEIEIHVSPEWRRRRGRAAQAGWEHGDPPNDSPAYDQRVERQRMTAEVEFVANVIGRLPGAYIERIRIATLDAGYQVASANRERRTVHFHSRFNDKMESFGSTEEYYIHEAGHLFDDEFLDTDCWREAQISDGEFISEYAALVPDREDLAETLIAYYALRYRPGRLDPDTERKIRETIPARIKCMDGWGLGSERPPGR